MTPVMFVCACCHPRAVQIVTPATRAARRNSVPYKHTFNQWRDNNDLHTHSDFITLNHTIS